MHPVFLVPLGLALPCQVQEGTRAGWLAFSCCGASLGGLVHGLPTKTLPTAVSILGLINVVLSFIIRSLVLVQLQVLFQHLHSPGHTMPHCIPATERATRKKKQSIAHHHYHSFLCRTRTSSSKAPLSSALGQPQTRKAPLCDRGDGARGMLIGFSALVCAPSAGLAADRRVLT